MSADAPAAAAPAVANGASSKPRLAVVFYSLYGHILRMAREIVKGVEEAGGEAVLFQVPETLSKEVQTLMHAPPKDESIPVIEDPAQLVPFDGILFGCGTRYGQFAAQMKAFFDRSGQVWMSGGWAGKPVGVFFSTATQGGGQETTAFTALTHFAHHAMVYVPIGYTDGRLNNNDEVHGGSAYGSGTIAGGDGKRQPSELELGVAMHQGRYFTKIAAALKVGKAALAN